MQIYFLSYQVLPFKVSNDIKQIILQNIFFLFTGHFQTISTCMQVDASLVIEFQKEQGCTNVQFDIQNPRAS